MTDYEVNDINQNKLSISDAQKQNSLLRFIVENSQTFDIYKKSGKIYPKILSQSTITPFIFILIGTFVVIAALLYTLPTGISMINKYIFAG